MIHWTTQAEIDTVGFRVLREVPGTTDKTVDVLVELIPANGHALIGASYEFLDNSKQAAIAVYYYIEDIDIYGKVTRHGPITVDRGHSTESRIKIDRKDGPRP